MARQYNLCRELFANDITPPPLSLEKLTGLGCVVKLSGSLNIAANGMVVLNKVLVVKSTIYS